MGEKARKLWKFGGAIVTWLLVIASAPTKVGLFRPFYIFVSDHWQSIWFRVAFTIIATILIFIFEIIDFWRPRVRVVLTPSGSASSELVLGVKNIGKDGDFRATCEVVGSRETCGIPLDRTVDLKWVGAGTAQVNLPVNVSANLLIASYDYYAPHNTSWLRLWGLDGQEKKQLSAAGWEREPKEKLPEFDLKLNIFRGGSIKPQTCYFTVRPASYIGPLEMFVSSSLERGTV